MLMTGARVDRAVSPVLPVLRGIPRSLLLLLLILPITSTTCSSELLVGPNCTPCADGSEPNALHNGCVSCAADSAGTQGRCERCEDGFKPTRDQAACQKTVASVIESLVLPLLSVLIPLAMWWWSRGSSTYIRQEDEDTEEDTRNEERDVESAAPGGRPRDPSIPLPPIVVRKLERPGETLSANESIECLISCIEFGVAQAECAKGRELVIIIGNTGAGKSTFVNMLEGCELERVTKEEACVVVEGGAGAEDEIVRVKPGSKPAEVMKIGHTKESMTFMPEVEPASSLGTGFSYADCPGFLDNRGFEINVANAVNIKQTITSAASVRAPSF